MNRQLNLEPIMERITQQLRSVEKARDESYILHREIIKTSGFAIRAVHRGDKEKAVNLLKETRDKVDQANLLAESLSDLSRSGFIHDAQKEYAEAAVTAAIVFGEEVPGPEQLNVRDASYLNGLAEVIGELRREILDLMRQDKSGEGERFLDAMEEIYSILVSMDFSDAVSGGLRRSTDQARGILERTRGDFTNFIISKKLRDDLNLHAGSTGLEPASSESSLEV